MPQRKPPRRPEALRQPQLEIGPPAALSRAARIAISGFLLWNLFAIVSWCVPLDSPLIARCRVFARPYLIWTGLFQKWDMFAPDPSRLNGYVSALITYRDGGTSAWQFPRMENLGWFDKYLEERYRKYANDCLRLDSNAGIWPDAARYIARVNYRPSNPPVAVALVRNWWIVPPPGNAPPGAWSQYTFFQYRVAAQDLP